MANRPSAVSRIKSHIELAHDIGVTNITHIRTRRRLVLCECGGKIYANALDIANTGL